jgi:hypothetical protein
VEVMVTVESEDNVSATPGLLARIVIYAQMVSVETDFARRNVLGILLAMVMADVEWNCRG